MPIISSFLPIFAVAEDSVPEDSALDDSATKDSVTEDAATKQNEREKIRELAGGRKEFGQRAGKVESPRANATSSPHFWQARSKEG
jgi:hypothetical protein